MRAIYFVVLTALFISGIFNQGLYFDQDFYPYHMVIHMLFIVFLIYIAIYKRYELKQYLIFMLIPLVFIIPLAFEPASSFLTIQGALRASTTTVFLMMSIYVFHKASPYNRYVPYVLHTVGAILSMHMLLFDAGIFSNGDYIMAGRYAGLVEYANTFGVIMATLFFYGLIQSQLTTHRYEKMCHLIFLPSYLFMLLQSQSRGVLLVSVIVFILLLFMTKIKEQLTFTIITSFALIISIITYVMMTKGHVFLSSLLLIGLSVLFVWGSLKLPTYLKRDGHFKRYIIPFGMIGIIGLVIMNIFSEGVIYHLLVDIFELDMTKLTRANSFTERQAFLLDGLKIFKESPLIGQGARAWALTYQDVRSYDYQSLEVHNGYLDMLIETGILGLSVIAGLFVLLIIRTFKREVVNRISIIPILVILIHSFIDFNLSYGFILFLLVILITSEVELNNQLLPKGVTTTKSYQLLLNGIFIMSCLTSLAIIAIL